MTTINQPIKGKVAKILTARELVINIGSKNGVMEGMKFVVLDPKGEDIKDPETGHILGSIERPKIKVKIIKVQENLSVASTFQKKSVNIGGTASSLMGSAVSDFFLPPKWIEKYETLKTKEKTWEDLDESESFVKTGDPVVQIIDNDIESEKKLLKDENLQKKVNRE